MVATQVSPRILGWAISCFLFFHLTGNLCLAAIPSLPLTLALPLAYGVFVAAVVVSLKQSSYLTQTPMIGLIRFGQITRLQLGFTPVIVIIMLASIWLINFLTTPWWPGDLQASNELYRDLIASPTTGIPLALIAVLIAPIIEEGFFRGFLQSQLFTLFDYRRAVIFTSALFSLLHPWPQIPLTFALSLWLGWIYHRGGLVWSILVHCIWNGLTLIYLLY